MTKRAQLTATAAMAVLLGALAAGCGGSSTTTSSQDSNAPPACLVPQRPVALAIGVRSNSPMPYLTPGIANIVNTAISAHETVAMVRLDGSPKVIFNQAFTPTGSNTQQRNIEYNTYINTLNGILQGSSQPTTDIQAQVGQADDLGGLDVAASEVPAGGDVVMIDSGVQTKEPLNFATGLLSDDPQTIVEYLKRAHELPDLAGKQVYFFGLGWTASPQPSLGISYRSKVVQIWQAIAHAAGAKCVGVDQNANTKAAVPNLPAVSLVHPPKPLAPPVACSTTDLNDANHVGFVFDSTTFRDPAGARVTLRKLANVILNNDDSIKLTGSTSSEGSDAYNQVLSLHRAQAVRAELEQFGVPGSRITAFGDGSHLPGRVNDRGPNGQLLIGPAIQNRKVVAKLTGPKCHSK
jgi:outer membrane protein OmpA-like peptidoglycan-associated protein